MRHVPPATYVTGSSISTTKTFHLDDPDGARGAPLSPHTAQRKPPFSPASQRVGAPTHAHPAVAHAVADTGKRIAALSGFGRALRSTLAAAAQAVLRCCVWSATAPRRGLGTAASPPPAAKAVRPMRAANGTAISSETYRR